ncbi:hypothetical protein [Rickettsiales endosymbiont of Stachyamoeba lipophora]|uniref:hypothetical protein n=1 Tax=Rickettsiales endosymbiont of Stachyamoeba lipophora TaxID=2486578 RepID=UPI000F646E96|nr:hypothetical protein [Rickettsiales endosymbiont of Stachyamoeba lipophora]AZL15279.1 hypothetical protein EF513_01740 [Rickettsiales endosymbiont of Stachyamoeba lipophora]
MDIESIREEVKFLESKKDDQNFINAVFLKQDLTDEKVEFYSDLLWNNLSQEKTFQCLMSKRRGCTKDKSINSLEMQISSDIKEYISKRIILLTEQVQKLSTYDDKSSVKKNTYKDVPEGQCVESIDKISAQNPNIGQATIEPDLIPEDQVQKLLTHYDDSSDEEDNYKDLSQEQFTQLINKFSEQNLNIAQATTEAAFILEDQGRRVIYNAKVRDEFLKKKEAELSHDQALLDAINKLNFKEVLTSAVYSAINSCYPCDSKKDYPEVEQYVSDIPGSLLARLSLKQSNKEFLLDRFQPYFKPLLEKLAEKLAEKQSEKENKAINLLKYQATAQKFYQIGGIKDLLKTYVKEKLEELHEYYKNNEDDRDEKVNELLGVEYTCEGFPDSIEDCLKQPEYKAPNGKTLNTFIKKALAEEITKYLKDGYIDQIDENNEIEDSKLLKIALDEAEQKGYRNITRCIFANAQQLQNITPEMMWSTTLKTFGAALSKSLKESLKLSNVSRKVLKINYTDIQKITSVKDFYTQELMLYRSAIRQSRNNVKKKIARTIVFNDDQDLIVQKSQDIKAQDNIGGTYVSNRGTIQEEVYNLGNYENILKEIETIKTVQNNILSDVTTAKMLRRVYKYGISGLEKLKSKSSSPISEHLTLEQKQTIINLVELFFGTEGFRSPAAIIETNMAIDLIISRDKKWAELLTGTKTIGKGGGLSFTMQSKEEAGGIECGRRLSEDVNLQHARKHKYGGNPIGRDESGYMEYLGRKHNLAKTWVEKIAEDKQDLIHSIKKRDKIWYGYEL